MNDLHYVEPKIEGGVLTEGKAKMWLKNSAEAGFAAGEKPSSIHNQEDLFK